MNNSMNLNHINNTQNMNEHGDLLTNYLRMPRSHELHYYQDKILSSMKDNETAEKHLLCNNCKTSPNSSMFLIQNYGTPNFHDYYLCGMCSIEFLVDNIVNQVLRNICCDLTEFLADKLPVNFIDKNSKGLCTNDENNIKLHIPIFSNIDFEKEIEPKSSFLKFSKPKFANIEQNKELSRNSPQNQNDHLSLHLPRIRSIDFEEIDHSQQNSENLDYSKGVKIHYGIPISQFYTDEQGIGSGKFGKVSRVTHIETKQNFAVKTITYYNQISRDNIINEIEILNCLRGSQHVMELIEVIDCNLTKPKTLHLITEYLDGGELFQQIANDELLTEEQVIGIMVQILDGVDFIHKRGFIHRDLKPENIIYSSKNNDLLKIIDFGLAVKFDESHPPKSMVGTTIFVAPEVLRFEPQSFLTDMWSVGVIAFNLLAGITPFEIPLTGDAMRELNDHEIIENIERCQYDFSDEGFIGVSEEAKSFISSLLIRKPSDRLSASECLQHKWLSSCYKKNLNANLSRSISLQRMKNYVAVHKWQN